MDLDVLLSRRRVIELGGSDLHLKVASPAMARIDGELVPLEERPLTDSDLETVLTLVTERTPAKREDFFTPGELDTAYMARGARALSRQRLSPARSHLVRLSLHPARRSRASSKLGLPGGVERLADEHRGLVLVTGATGSGKSTTLAAMINAINRSRKQHIVTIEDPIEFVHDDWGCIVNQREVGLDTESYTEALRRVLRQDPDVILIGELRDEESARAALQAAESGHFVLSTMHTIDAAETVGRLVEFFPPAQAADGAPDPRRGPARRRQPAPSAEDRRRPRRRGRGDGQHGADRRSHPRPDERTRSRRRSRKATSTRCRASRSTSCSSCSTAWSTRRPPRNAASNRHDFEIAVQQALRATGAASRQSGPSAEAERAAEEPAPTSNGVGSATRLARSE